MRCIICGEEKEPSKEHIIPEALGNKNLITYNVCEQCNNDLGHEVDDYLSNHILIKFIRVDQHITGYGGKEVKIFPGTCRGDDGRLYDLSGDKPKIIPQVVKTDNGLWKVEAETAEEGIALIQKKLKRRYKSIDNLEDKIVVQKTKTSQPTFSIPADVDTGRVDLSVVKIAYEYCCEKIGNEYYSDSIARIFRDALERCIGLKPAQQDYSSYMGYVNWRNPYALKLFHEYERDCENLDPRHVIMLHGDAAGQLICDLFPFMDEALVFTVLCSENMNQYSTFRTNATRFDMILKDGEVISF